MSDASWTVGLNTGDVIVDFVQGSVPSYQRAKRQTLTVGFRERSSGSSALDRYESLRELGDYAHTVATFTSIEGAAFYRENHTTSTELLVSFEPSQDVKDQNIPGFWGVVVGVQDETMIPGADASLGLEVFLLAEFKEYADRSAVKSDKEL
jgi:hypothetical protein